MWKERILKSTVLSHGLKWGNKLPKLKENCYIMNLSCVALVSGVVHNFT